jgi:FkbM family methyltransferase
MDNTNYAPKMTMAVAEAGLLADEPFTLVDVGCSLGIDSVWRFFGGHLRAFGFDPDIIECERLQRIESNPGIRYYPMAVGLPEDSDFLRAKAVYDATHPLYWRSVWGRSTALDPRFTPASRVAGHGIPAEVAETAKIGVSEFLEHQEVGSVDFVKVDTDGSELEVLLSAEKSIESRRILGFMVECLYQGSDHETSDTFHNIDRFMKRHGFMVYSMTVNKYSRAVLPAPFVYSFPAQTNWGQALWGDVVFLRDLGAPSQSTPELSVAKIIKLACLYEIFCVPDCAVELILQSRERIAARVDPGALLDLVTPPLHGGALTYQAYLDAIAANPRMLFPEE